MRCVVALLALAACNENPPFALRFRVTDGDSFQCLSPVGGQVASKCEEISFPCEAVVSIRILPPANPSLPYISLCQPLRGNDLCSLNAVDLPPPEVDVPEQRLEVQMAIYAAYLLPTDDQGEPMCPPPSKVFYGADGFPVTQALPCQMSATDPNDPQYCWPVPSMGGVSYYTPGDSKTVVELGCTSPDFSSLECEGTNKVTVNATISDFDLPAFSIPGGTGGLADRLIVAVGEPQVSGDSHVLNPKDVRPLSRTVIAPVPVWSAELENFTFGSSECVQVFEEVAQSTATDTCRPPPMMETSTFNLSGVRLSKTTLDQIIRALDDESATDPPFTLDKGLVLGVVLDENGSFASGHVVTTDQPATIEYLSPDRGHFVTGGTSSAGIFLSRDAPYGTTFTSQDGTKVTAGYGGLIAGKVTIVVLQFGTMIGQ
jgi:hypothetical protein